MRKKVWSVVQCVWRTQSQVESDLSRRHKQITRLKRYQTSSSTTRFVAWGETGPDCTRYADQLMGGTIENNNTRHYQRKKRGGVVVYASVYFEARVDTKGVSVKNVTKCEICVP